jgi:hypothetical protein
MPHHVSCTRNKNFGNPPAWDGNYYVDPAGNDANDGKSQALPFQTTTPVNALSLLPGQKVMFKAGGVWSDQALIVPSSGDATHNITFTRYGAGANPLIDASKAYTSWTADTGAIYYAACTRADSAFHAVYENGVRLIRKTTYATLAVGSFFLDDPNNKLYVWCTDGGDPATKTMKMTDKTEAVDTNYQSYLVFDGIDAYGAVLSGYDTRRQYGHDITVYNAVSSWSTQRCFNDGAWADRADHSRIVFVGCTAHDSIGEGFWLGFGTASGCISCTSYNNGYDGGKGYSGIQAAGQSFTIGSSAIDCYLLQCVGYNNKGGSAHNSVEYVIAEGNQPLRTVIDRCRFYRSDANNIMFLIDEGNTTSITNNLFYASTGGMWAIKHGNAADVVATNCVDYHNTFYTSVDGAAQFIQGSYATGLKIKNNIMFASGNSGYPYQITADAETGFESDYNNVKRGSGSGNWGKWGASWYTWANWKTNTSQDTHSLDASDPLFVTNGSDFHLQSGSPCRNAGIGSLGVTHDYDNVARDATVEIGAYEYV